MIKIFKLYHVLLLMDKKNLESSIRKNKLIAAASGIGALTLGSMGGVITYVFVDVILSGRISNILDEVLFDIMVANAIALGVGYGLGEHAWDCYKKVGELKKSLKNWNERNYRV